MCRTWLLCGSGEILPFSLVMVHVQTLLDGVITPTQMDGDIPGYTEQLSS